MWKKYHCISVLRQNCLNGFLIFETKYTHYRFHRRYDQGIQLTQLISIYIKLHYDTRFAKKIYWRYACVILPTILRQKKSEKDPTIWIKRILLENSKKIEVLFCTKIAIKCVAKFKSFLSKHKNTKESKIRSPLLELVPNIEIK